VNNVLKIVLLCALSTFWSTTPLFIHKPTNQVRPTTKQRKQLLEKELLKPVWVQTNSDALIDLPKWQIDQMKLLPGLTHE
jgi:hypothetical protein